MRDRVVRIVCLVASLTVAGGLSPTAASSPTVDPAELPLESLHELARARLELLQAQQAQTLATLALVRAIGLPGP